MPDTNDRCSKLRKLHVRIQEEQRRQCLILRGRGDAIGPDLKGCVYKRAEQLVGCEQTGVELG